MTRDEVAFETACGEFEVVGVMPTEATATMVSRWRLDSNVEVVVLVVLKQRTLGSCAGRPRGPTSGVASAV